MARWARALFALAALNLASCEKVPITQVNAAFTLADATWFADEQTLFIFYRVDADQGLSENSQIEVRFRTDTVDQPWVPLQSIAPVHTHLPTLCGPGTLCGSTSLKVTDEPRDIAIRMKWHRDGSLALDAFVTLNIINSGPAFSNRSLLVYGVFDETNTQIEWRARHQFPTMRNELAQQFGLRRYFKVEAPAVGPLISQMPENPYGYAFSTACPGLMTPLAWQPVETRARAIFQSERLDVTASTLDGVCAKSTVTDAKGTFSAPVIARKNPEVHPAFAELRSPVKVATQIGLVLRPCAREISESHRKMQTQRLLLETSPQLCIDDWQDKSFPDTLASNLRARIDAERVNGKDMVLTLVLNHDDTSGEFAQAVEAALLQIMPFERDKTSPRVSGAFVFDSIGRRIVSPILKRLVLWCPAKIDITDLDLIPGHSESECPILPDTPDINLGPFKFGTLPILPTRDQYLTFIRKYSEGQAGRTIELEFRSPERTPLSQNFQVGEFGVVTFFNNEIITADPTDAFSFCTDPNTGAQLVVFRTPLAPDPLPISALPQVQSLIPQGQYPVGLAWDFPMLMRMKYEIEVAGAATAFSVTVPFGTGISDQKYYGTELWKRETFPIGDTLVQCTRFCDFPTFDSDGVYNVQDTFRAGYPARCYRPKYPTPADMGFPHDP